jgi:hypothetical protein
VGIEEEERMMAITWGPEWGTTNQYIVWNVGYELLSQSVENNTSTIRAHIRAHRTNTGYTTSGTADVHLNAGLGWNSISKRIELTSSWLTLWTKDFTVTHNTDGTYTLPVGGAWQISGIVTSDDYQQGKTATFALPTIPRASSFTLSPASVDMGAALTVNIVRASSSFTHDVKMTWNGTTTTVASKTTSVAVSYTIPITWGAAIPSATSGACTVTVDTYSGTTKIGTATKQLTVTVPTSAVPTLGALTIAQIYDALSPAVPSAWGVFVQGRSGAKATLASATGAMGSTISRVEISGGGYSVVGTGLVLTTGAINAAGAVVFTATVTDSRGRTATKTASVTFVAYSPPSFVGNVLSQRANASSQIVNDGTYGAATAIYKYSSVSDKNAVTRGLRYRESGASTWIDVADGFSSGVPKFFGGGGLDVAKSYDVQYGIADAFVSVTATDVISQVTAILKVDGSGLKAAFYKEPTLDGLDIGCDFYLKGAALTLPVSVANGGTGMTGVKTYNLALVVNGTTWPSTLQFIRMGNLVQVYYSNGSTGITCPAGDYRNNIIPSGYRPVQLIQYESSNAAFTERWAYASGTLDFRIRLSSALSNVQWVYFWGVWITADPVPE